MSYMWIRDWSVGEEWMTGIMAHHQSLSVRTPEATSFGRRTAFNA